MEDALIISKFADERTGEEAFELLLEKYQQKIYWHVRRMVIDSDDAGDVAREIFARVWRNLDKFREDSQLYTWLYRIATKECLTFVNKKKKQNKLCVDDENATYLAETLSGSQYFEGYKAQMKMQQALLTLPEKQRMVFNMKYFEDLKYDEISEIVGTSRSEERRVGKEGRSRGATDS